MHPWTLFWTKSEGNPAAMGDDADRVARAAREYLRAGAGGEPCAHLAVALAEAVLDEEAVQLALKVLEGGPFAHARAMELAERVVQNTDKLMLHGTTAGPRHRRLGVISRPRVARGQSPQGQQ
jgi:hypothetical protein